MPSDKNDYAAQKKPAKPHSKKRLMWYLSAGLLVVVIIVFVFSPVVGAFVPQEDSIVFGYYDGQPIEYAYGNYFYQQQRNIASNWDQQGASSGEQDYQRQMYQIWKSAFDNTVIHTAVMQQADRSGLIVTEDAVDAYLLENGPYINEEGNFSNERYQRTSDAEKQEIRESAKQTLKFQTALQDMLTTVASEKEIDFIAGMASEQKQFDYVSFDASLYPRERVLSYGQSNAILFTETDLSMLTLPADDQEANQDLYDQISSGAISFEEAVSEYSTSSNTENGGRIGTLPFHELASFLGSEDSAHQVFSLGEGKVSEVLSTDYGNVMFKVNEAPVPPDFEDDQVISSVRSYLESNEPDLVVNYLASRADSFAEQAENDSFESAAQSGDLEVFSTDSTPLNYGNSQFMNSFSYTDSEEELKTLASDEEALRDLFTLNDQEISGPIAPEDTAKVIVAQCVETSELEPEQTNVGLLYPYLFQNLKQQEFQRSILESDKLENNFLQVFFTQVLQQNS
ncbi:MAG: peptidylprolyl isomerase [Spirochaetota bacterium]